MKENTSISERLLKVIEHLNLNPNSFGLSLGYKRSQVIYDITDADKKRELAGLKPVKPSTEFYERFLNSEYSEIFRIEWLITGEGEMLKSKPYDSGDSYQDNENRVKDGRAAYNLSRIDKLLDIVESQQKVAAKDCNTINNLSETIKELTKKKNGNNGNNDIAGAV